MPNWLTYCFAPVLGALGNKTEGVISQVRRVIEDTNAKRRKALRRHYNETVRELATFVRKRDKRVMAHTVPLSFPSEPPGVALCG